MKKISFIIPTYNIRNYISKCLDSILLQWDSDLEVIVVNDGSTDNVDEILSFYEKKYDCLKVINKPNGGLSSARNAGIKIATGKYIWFVDGDDTICSNAFELLNKYINDNYDIIFFNYNTINKTETKLIVDDYSNSDNETVILTNTSPCTKIFNRKFFKKNNFEFDEGIIYEDLAIVPYIVSKAKTKLVLNEPLYNYIYRSNSIMNSKGTFKKNRDNKFIAINNLLNRFKCDNNLDKYFDELEFLIIKHLLITYSTEILIYGRKIYYNRCILVDDYLNDFDKNWFKNKYLKKISFLKRMFVFLFKIKLFGLCKMFVLILRKVGKI